jgi:muramoyltetrapeptide carboxypeptidase LdcA involved in peptidoglycan recycling
MLIGTELWPKVDEWDNKILFLETSEECPAPSMLKYFLRNLAAQGIIDRLNGIILGKPFDEKYYDNYKEVLMSVIVEEAGRSDLPILYNVNFGHTSPICILPYGVEAMIDCENKALSICESAVV